MATPYRLRKRYNPRKLEEKAKYFPTPYYAGMITTEELTEDISYGTTLTETDVRAVLTTLSNKIVSYIELGYKVQLDDLGIFKLSFSGEGKEDKSEITARDIDDIHILFTPEPKIKRLIKRFKFRKHDFELKSGAGSDKSQE